MTVPYRMTCPDCWTFMAPGHACPPPAVAGPEPRATETERAGWAVVRELKAGPELDAVVAREVFGDRVINPDLVGVANQDARSTWRLESLPYPPGGIRYEPVPAYSTDIAAVWQVVERLRELGITDISVQLDVAEYGWMAGVDGHYAGAATAPLALCLAALNAMEDSHA